MNEGEEEESKQLSAPEDKDADFDSTPSSKADSKSSRV